MMEKTYTIVLSDGTELTGLTLNGNNFVSQEPIDPDIFKYNTSPVTIRSDETEEVHEHMEFVQVMQMPNGYYFVLIDVPENELRMMKMESDIAYIQMMTDL